MLSNQKFDEYKSAFLKVFPDGQGFDNPQYLENERSYKLELADTFEVELAPLLRSLP